MRLFYLSLFISIATLDSIAQEDKSPKKGSYLYYGQPTIEDNSMFIEEAFNQEAKIIQHISNLIFDDGDVSYFYTNEIPMKDYYHQFSFTAEYTSLKDGNRGFGDLLINYRPLIWGKNDWALVIPRFTLIMPTGDAKHGLGDGCFGGQFNLAVTKRLNKKITTHWNAGYTHLGKAKAYSLDNNGAHQLDYKRKIQTVNLGASAFYLLNDHVNLVTEYIFTSGKELGVTTNSQIINPGIRFAFQGGKTQFVPGIGVPFYATNGNWKQSGVFIYFSIEPDYNR